MKENDTNYWFFEASRWNALGRQSMILLIYFKDFQELSERSVANFKGQNWLLGMQIHTTCFKIY